MLFVYNRAENTERTLEYLKNNTIAKDTELYIFSDAAKTPKGKAKVDAVREIIRRADGFKSVTVYEAEQNKGLSRSVIGGVTQIIEKYGRVIVLEDDLATSPVFLQYMNDALDFYEKDSRIWSISGYQYPFEMPESYKESVYLTYRGSSWGWASWKDRWETIDWEVSDYKAYKYNPKRIAHFCKGGTDLDKMLRWQMRGKLDSWAIRWCYSQSCQRRYSVYPRVSLIRNGGLDGSGTHCDPSAARWASELAMEFDYSFKEGMEIDKAVQRLFRKQVDRSIMRKLKRILHLN